MIYLLLSIILSASLFILFKHFDAKGIHLLSSIIGNYMACIISGSLSSSMDDFLDYDLISFGLHFGLGFLFFGIFFLMGRSSALNGVAITGMAGKMSLLLTVLLLALIMDEPFGTKGFVALGAGLTALVLMTSTQNLKIQFGTLWMPILIFLGSGVIDTCLAILKNRQIDRGLEQEPGIVFIFMGALAISYAYSLLGSEKQRIRPRHIPSGFLLGIVNFYSIQFMLLAIAHRGAINLNEFYMINNIGVVLVTFAAGALFFKESLNIRKLIGLGLALSSICMVLYT